MKRSHFGLLLFLLTLLAFIPKDRDPIEKIIGSLQKWTETNPQEKVYLHTDKPYYVVGDTIWFKAYTVIGDRHQLSALSGALYIDLFNEADSLTESLKLPLTAGMAKGSIVLADSIIKEGNYRIRAYTQWMRNAGPDYFYDKVFMVGNSFVNPLYSKIDYTYGKEHVLIATLTYTDKIGKPFINKNVSYNLRKDFNSIAKGKGVTDENGELRVVLKKFKIEDLSVSHLSTRIELDDKEFVLKTFPIKLKSEEVDVQFFPEGGTLVNGVKSRIAFKATGTDGLGVAIKGIVFDNSGIQVAEFNSQHLGMGYFTLTPVSGKSYQIKVIYPDGKSDVVKLANATDMGYGFAVYNNTSTDTILVKVHVSKSIFMHPDQQVVLIVQSGGTVQFVCDVPINKSTAVLEIPAKEFSSGIAQFTLMSMAGAPLNERLVFIQNNDQMDLNVSSSKKVYAKREKIEIDIASKDQNGNPLTSNLSVAVTHEDVVPVDEIDEHTMFSQLLLSADIKGYIEKPNYYFYKPDDKTKSDLDVLMMTQGYRRFLWQDFFSGKPIETPFKAEQLVTELSGRLLSLWGKPIAKGEILLSNNRLGLLLDTLTDEAGRFGFNNLVLTDGIPFSIQGRRPNKGQRVELVLDKVPIQEPTPNINIGDVNTNIRETMKVSIENNKILDEDLQRNGYGGYLNLLREVKIKAKKRYVSGMARLKEAVEQTLVFKKTDRCKIVLHCLMKRIGEIYFEMVMSEEYGVYYKPQYRKMGMSIYVNNKFLKPEEAGDLFMMDPSEIVRVDVVRSDKFVSPSLLFYTKSPYFVGRYNPSIITVVPRGFNTAKEFYLPKYNMPDSTKMNPDLRTTIYWNPSILTKDGKAMFSFFNGDAKGNYRVVVEGINSDGLLGRQVYRYKID